MTTTCDVIKRCADHAVAVGWNAPGSFDTRLWLVELDTFGCIEADALNLLTPREQDRALRFRFERDARRYRVSHVVLNALLAQLTGRAPANLALTENAHGKPLFTTGRWHFNLSHSGGWALIGAGAHGSIGVDIEVPKAMCDADEMARQHFTNREILAYEHSSGSNRVRSFYRCWTRKEACLKAVGSGLSIEPNTFEVGEAETAAQTSICFESRQYLVKVWTVPLSIEAVAAVALSSDADPRPQVDSSEQFTGIRA